MSDKYRCGYWIPAYAGKTALATAAVDAKLAGRYS
jgi:hypothetical protein